MLIDCLSLSIHILKAFAEGIELHIKVVCVCVCALYAAVCLCQCRHMKPETHIMVVLQVRKIDRKLKACHNPLLDPDSDLFKQLAAATEQQEHDQREKKVRCSILIVAASQFPNHVQGFSC